MLSEKEKLENELKLLEESLSLNVITKEEFETAKRRVDEKLNALEKEETKVEEKPEIEPEGKKEEAEVKEEESIIKYEDVEKEKEEPIKEEKPEEKKEEVETQKKLEEVKEEKPAEEVIIEQKPKEEVKKEEEKAAEEAEKEEIITEEKKPEIIFEDEEKISGKKILAYIAIIIILVIIGWNLFFSNGEDVEDVSGDEPLDEIVSLIACSSDNDCVEEGKIGVCKNPGEENAECEYIEDVKIKLTVLNNENCFNCDTSRVLTIIKTFYPNLDIENIDFETEEAKELIENYNIKALPAYILDSNFKDAHNYEKLSSSFNEVNGSFVMKNTVANANYYIERIEIENKLDLFIKEDHVASSQAEDNLQEFLDAFGDNVVFEKYNEDAEIVKELGINTFPTFLINNKIKFSGVQPADTIKENFCQMNMLDECSLELSKSLV